MIFPSLRRSAALVVFSGGVLLAGAGRAAAAPFIHIVIVADVTAEKVGESLRVGADHFLSVFHGNVPADRFHFELVGANGLGHDKIIQAIRNLRVKPKEDVVLVYTASHGGVDPAQGAYLYFPGTREHVLRQELRTEIEARAPRLGILLTESCNDVATIPGGALAMAAPMAGLPNQAFSPLLRSLLLGHVGFVDIASSKEGEKSLCYPKARIEPPPGEGGKAVVFAYRGGIFTEAIAGSMEMFMQEPMRWDQLSTKTAAIVDAEFRGLYPNGLENPNAPENVQGTQTVTARSVGTWAPLPEEMDALANRMRFGMWVDAAAGGGVRVTRVNRNSTAARMGLEPGDVILTVNGEPFADRAAFLRLVKGSPEDIEVTLRDVNPPNKVVTRTGRLDADAGDGGPPPPQRVRFGAAAVPHNGGKKGLFVTHLVPDSPAAKLRLDYGDIIMRINGQEINDQDTYHQAVHDSPDVMDLTIRNVRTGRLQSYKVPLDR